MTTLSYTTPWDTTPASFRESVKVAEQNLYSQARSLVGDRDPVLARQGFGQVADDPAVGIGVGQGDPILEPLEGQRFRA